MCVLDAGEFGFVCSSSCRSPVAGSEHRGRTYTVYRLPVPAVVEQANSNAFNGSANPIGKFFVFRVLPAIETTESTVLYSTVRGGRMYLRPRVSVGEDSTVAWGVGGGV